MHKQPSSRPLQLPSPSNAIPCDFNRVWLRMTARECLNVCSAYNLITSSPILGNEPDQMPSDLSAEGALAWMSWNQGRGNYYFGALDPLAPRKIANAASMTLWLDGQDRATLLDGSGDPVTDGVKVATWADKSGAGHDFTQATDGDRSHWYANGYVNFPGGVNRNPGLISRSSACAQCCDSCRASPMRCGVPAGRIAMVPSAGVSRISGVAVGELPRVRRRARWRPVPKSTARE